MSRIRKHIMGASNIDCKATVLMTMSDKAALRRRLSKAKISRNLLEAYSQHVRNTRPHQNSGVSREEFVHRTIRKGERPASARMLRLRQKRLNNRLSRPSSAQVNPRILKQSQSYSSAGFRKLLAPPLSGRPPSKLTAAKRFSNNGSNADVRGETKKDGFEHINKLVLKMRCRFEGKSNQKLFRHWDRSHKGSLSADDMEHMFKSLALPLKKAELDSLVKKYDNDGDGRLQYNEFMRLVRFPAEFQDHPHPSITPKTWNKEPPKVPHYLEKTKQSHFNITKRKALKMLRAKFQSHSSLRKIFLTLDEHRDGIITFGSFQKLLKCNNIRLPPQDVTEMFQGLDINRDGSMQYEEFRQWVFDKKEDRSPIRTKSKEVHKVTDKVGKVDSQKMFVVAELEPEKVTEVKDVHKELADTLHNSESSTKGADTHHDRLILQGAAKKLRRHRIAARSAFERLGTGNSVSAENFSHITSLIEKTDKLKNGSLLTPEEMGAMTAFLQQDQTNQGEKTVSFKDFNRWFLRNHQKCIINGDGNADADHVASEAPKGLQNYRRQNTNARAMIFRPRSNDMHIWKPHFNFGSLVTINRAKLGQSKRQSVRHSDTKHLIAPASNADVARRSRWRSESSMIGRGHVAAIKARKSFGRQH